MSPTYIPLRTHSAYSLLEGAIPIDVLIKRAVDTGLPALALCDTGNLFGALEFSLACQKAKIQPILGCLLRLHQTSSEGQSLESVLPVFVQNETGYRNLCRLVTQLTEEGEASPRGALTLPQLSGLTEGLIALSGGYRGLLNRALEKGAEEASEVLSVLESLFPGRLYIELERLGLPGEADSEERLINLAYARHLPLIATNEAFFLDEGQFEAHDALLCVADGTYVSVPDRRRLSVHHRLKSPQEMGILFADLPEALHNTVALARRCSFLLKSRDPMLPAYLTETGRNEADELRHIASEGLKKRLTSVPEGEWGSYEERLLYELDVIIQMGFPGYFLIVADFIQWAKGQGIPVGPGRGSGAGSVVAWALTITDLDPIRFSLLFERFLNPERVSMPDFDIDFCQTRRDEVIHYVREKYGADRVAHIITFGKLQARAVLRDVGRVLQMPYGQIDGICKRIPNNPAHPVTLAQALAQDPELGILSESDPQVERLLSMAQELEGLYRHASTHAAGIVIGDRPLVEYLPLYQDPRSILPATQFSMKYVELAGLVKFDFLGLKTLTVLSEATNLLRLRGVEIDVSQIPLDDPKTFELLRRVETTGLFQLESAGMGEVLRKLQPEAFEEIIALVALYRPGPMDDIPRYLACRHGQETVTYPYPCLEGILKETFGVMVYQEQVLQIARTLAGYTLGGADILRRAMGKKIQSEMDAQRKIFVDGVLAHQGGKPEIASHLFDQIAKFAGYAFNKAHATAYALIIYQTAYMKAHYPMEFMAASMTLDAQNTDKLAVLAREVKRMGIPLYPPDINTSEVVFSVALDPDTLVTQGIRYGLSALKNVGEGAVTDIIAERSRGGAFKHIFDVFERLSSGKTLNKRQMESLIQAGAFDCLNPQRKQLVESLDLLLKYAAVRPQTASLFDLEETRPPLAVTPPFTPLERLRAEFAAVGFYLSEHPLDLYGGGLRALRVVNSDQLPIFLETLKPQKTFTMAGVLIAKQEKTSKKGQKYAFLQLSDGYGVFEATAFSDLLSESRETLVLGKPLLLTLTGRLDEDVIRLSLQKVQDLDAMIAEQARSIDVHLQSSDQLKDLAALIKRTLSGKTQVRVHLPFVDGEGVARRAIFRLPGCVQLSEDLRHGFAGFQAL